jgi:hypothetical protein
MAKSIAYNKPGYRKLRGYAFDPITSLDQDTADINQITYQVPWEDNLKEGPEGEYIKVIRLMLLLISINRRYLPQMGWRLAKPTRSFTSKWCMR